LPSGLDIVRVDLSGAVHTGEGQLAGQRLVRHGRRDVALQLDPEGEVPEHVGASGGQRLDRGGGGRRSELTAEPLQTAQTVGASLGRKLPLVDVEALSARLGDQGVPSVANLAASETGADGHLKLQ